MIRHAFLIAVALSAAGCKKHKAAENGAADSVGSANDPKPFTLACAGQIVDDMGLARGALKFGLTIDAANNEALVSNAAADRAEILPPAFENHNGDIVRITMNDHTISADLNDGARQDADNRITIDRRTGKFSGPNSSGSCAKSGFIPMPNQKF